MLVIETITAFIGVDKEGEGLAGFQFEPGVWMPMVCADQERVDQLRSVAQQISTRSGKEIKVVQFTVRTELETIKPESR